MKRLLGEKVQEVDFFKGALRGVEARRLGKKESTGARAFMISWGKPVRSTQGKLSVERMCVLTCGGLSRLFRRSLHEREPDLVVRPDRDRSFKLF